MNATLAMNAALMTAVDTVMKGGKLTRDNDNDSVCESKTSREYIIRWRSSGRHSNDGREVPGKYLAYCASTLAASTSDSVASVI